MVLTVVPVLGKLLTMDGDKILGMLCSQCLHTCYHVTPTATLNVYDKSLRRHSNNIMGSEQHNSSASEVILIRC